MRILKIQCTYVRPPKYVYDATYFDELTLENCYWAGILQTDGCLLRNSRTGYLTIVWGCAAKDKPLMELFKRHINSTHPIHMQQKKCALSTVDTEKLHPQCKIVFEGAHQWAASLKRHFGFDHNKTLRTLPPKLPSLKHRLAFLKGLVDGDGCITQDGTNKGISFSFCGVNREIVQWVKDTVDSLELPSLSNRDASVAQREDESCHYYRISGLTAAILHQILYRLPTPHLARKYENPKVMDIVNYWKARPEWPAESLFARILSG